MTTGKISAQKAKLRVATKKVVATKVAAPAKRGMVEISKSSVAKARRVILDPAAKPRHFTVAAIRNAVRQVIAGK